MATAKQQFDAIVVGAGPTGSSASCERTAIAWEYPRGGWGVSFRAS